MTWKSKWHTKRILFSILLVTLTLLAQQTAPMGTIPNVLGIQRQSTTHGSSTHRTSTTKTRSSRSTTAKTSVTTSTTVTSSTYSTSTTSTDPITTLTTASSSVTSTLASSTTTTTSGSTADMIGGTLTNNSLWGGAVHVFSLTASASGTLTSVGVNVEGPSSNIETAVYGTLSGGTLSGLLGSSASTAAVAGWNDLPISGGISIVSGTTYYVAFQVSGAGSNLYYVNSGTNYAYIQSYGSFPSSTTVTAGTGTVNMRMTYSAGVVTTATTTSGTSTLTTASSSVTSTLASSTTTTTSGSTACSYQVFTDGTTTYAENCQTGAVVYSGTVAATIINDAISALYPGGGKIFIKAGTYIITTPVVTEGTHAVSNVELYGEGNSTILSAAVNLNDNVIAVFGVNGWYVHDLQINGNRAEQSGPGTGGGYDGIQLYNCSNCIVERNYIHDVKTLGIYIHGTNIKILDNDVVNSNANGIIVSGGSNYLVEGNIVNGASDVGISISGTSATQTISGVVCEGNIITNINLDVSPYGANSGDGIITGDNGIAGGNITISNNYVDVAYVGMWISQTQGVTVSGNTIIPTATGWGVGIAIGAAGDEPTESAIIESNHISSASDGIYVYSSTTSTVQFLDNTITSTGTPIVTNSAPVIVEGNVGYNPVGPISSPISGGTIVDSGSSNKWTSGTTYTNWESPKLLSISGGTVTAIEVNGQALSPTTSTITLQPGDTFSITFSSTPTIKVSGQ